MTFYICFWLKKIWYNTILYQLPKLPNLKEIQLIKDENIANKKNSSQEKN